MKRPYQILPSLLAADQANLGDACRRVLASGADALHLDVMDGHFVTNLSYSPDTSSMARRLLPGFPINTHLMITNPEFFAPRFIAAGSTTVQFHVEIPIDTLALLAHIRTLGARAGLVLNPDTPPQRAFPFLAAADEILCMTVFPGYGGQTFIREVLPKIAAIRAEADRIGHPELDIMVDGGIDHETAVLSARAGANQFVAGSFLFKQADMAAAIAEMRRRLQTQV